jgi:hypothetical protein
MAAVLHPLPLTQPPKHVEPAPSPEARPIDPDEWKRALEKTQRAEEEAGKRLFPNGKPIPILWSDPDDL